MAEEQYSSQIKIDKCILSKADGSKKEPLTNDMIISYTAQESILSPFMTASIILSDSKNVLNNFPIQGGENLEFSVKTSWSDKSTVYKFKVYKISGRIVKNKKQVYQLSLISSEALLNETIRVQTMLEGNPEGIIAKLLKGDNFLSRCGESIIINSKNNFLIANNTSEYISKTVFLSENLDKLNVIRQNLYDNILTSNLFDSNRFSKNFNETILSIYENHN